MLVALTFCGGTVSVLLLTPLFRRIAVKCGFMDCPASNHKGHKAATPLLGGAAMFTGWVLCILCGVAAVLLNILPGCAETFSKHIAGFHYASGQLAFLVSAAALAVIIGLADDKWALSASVKFGGQFIVALTAVLGGGVKINLFFSNPVIVCAISIFWIMLLMNSINFFDNMDGLAVGTIAVAMGFFTVIAILNCQYFMAVFSALNFGICCGFWFYNASPATIFMGDSGSHFLGFLAAVVSAGTTFFNYSTSLTTLSVLIPLLILALPLFDTLMVVLIRTKNRKPFWIGDHNHISHRFVKMGLSRKNAVIAVHLLSVVLSLGALPIYWGNFIIAAIMVVQAVLVLTVVTILQICAAEK